MHIDKTKLGDIIRSARESKGLSQAALADKIRVSTRTIIAIEKNQRNPTFEVLYQLVHALDVSANQIFYPDQETLTTEQDQFIREFLACNANEQRIALATLQSLIRALRQ